MKEQTNAKMLKILLIVGLFIAILLLFSLTFMIQIYLNVSTKPEPITGYQYIANMKSDWPTGQPIHVRYYGYYIYLGFQRIPGSTVCTETWHVYLGHWEDLGIWVQARYNFNFLPSSDYPVNVTLAGWTLTIYGFDNNHISVNFVG